MILRRSLFTLVITLTALIIACSVAFATDAKVDNETYTHPSKFNNCIVIDGVDTSYWQGAVDWDKVKKSGIDYVIMRIGYTNEDSPFRRNPDSWFEYNFERAKAAGLQVGVYYYAQPITTTEAKQEAEYVLKLLEGRDLDLPVVYDIEMPSADGGSRVTKAYNSWSSSTRRAKMTSNALSFLKVIQDGGYNAMFYSYRNLISDLYGKRAFDMPLIEGKYKVWMAQYSTNNSYAGEFEHWQYTSSGSVNGISGRSDCNFWYFDNSKVKIKAGTTAITGSDITLGINTYTYTGGIKRPAVKVSLNGRTLTEGTDYKVRYIKNVLSGTAYAMVYGKGNYSGVSLQAFTIKRQSLTPGNVSINAIPDTTYTGSAKKPSITIKRGTATVSSSNYTLKYTNNVNAGTATVTATGVRNYTGSISKTFKINKATPKVTTTYTTYSKDSNDAPFSLNGKSTSGAKVTYKSNDTTIATVSTDGKVTLTGKSGTVTISVTCPSTANYNSGGKTVTVNVDFVKKTPTISTTTTLNKEVDDDPFTIKYTTTSDGAVSFKSSNTAIATVSSSGLVKILKEGTVKITISTAETSAYHAGTKTITCVIDSSISESDKLINGVRETDIDISSLVGSNYIRLNWKKEPGFNVDGYQLYRSTKSTTGFTSIYNTTGTTCKNIKNLIKDTKYYYKVRGYRTINNVKVHTKWSKTIYSTSKVTSNDVIKKGVEKTDLKISSSASSGYIKLIWTKEAGFRVDGYQLYRSTKKTTGFTSIYKTKGTTCKNTKNLKKGTTYYYKVRGYRTVDGDKIYTKWSNLGIRTAK